MGWPCGQQIAKKVNKAKKSATHPVGNNRNHPVFGRRPFLFLSLRGASGATQKRSTLALVAGQSRLRFSHLRNCRKHQQEWCGPWTAVKFFSSELTGFYQDGDESCHRSDVAGEPFSQLGHSHMFWHAERIQRKGPWRGREGSWEHLYQGWRFFFPFSFSVLFGSIISHESRAEGLTNF